MSWYDTFDSVFWITLAGILTGSLGLCIRYSLKSKCDLVKICCGLLEIHRSVELEKDVEITSNNENNL
jgi:hypothetical protein